MSEKKIEKNTILCCVIFAVYAVLTLIGAANHELWFDEAQAWTIARDNTIAGIFQQLRFEGHPPLWYLILYVPSHMGLSCDVIPYISWFITALAGALIMFRAPFNIFVKSAVLFSGGFLYVNSVTSRVYCLINLTAVLIAMLYPKRKEHPIMYGVLIALLANTHISMSGFIGIVGIFMIIDLFKDIRLKSIKQRVCEITGLGIAGMGVLTMVIPLLGSVSANSYTSSSPVTFGRVVSSFSESFLNISLSIINYIYHSNNNVNAGLAIYFLSGLVSAAFIAMIILMRHKTRPFLMLLFFWIFYTVTTEVFLETVPSRALIFAFMYFIVGWIAESEPQNNAAYIFGKTGHKTGKLPELIKKLDRNFVKSYISAITAIALISVPVGAYYLFSDYVKDFCPSETTAEYIQENFPEGSVFVSDEDNCSQLAAYLPEYKFYSTDFGRFYTYSSHEVNSYKADNSQIYNDLKGYDNIYYVFVSTDIDCFPNFREIIYSVRDGMAYGVNVRYIEISEFDVDKEISSFI